MLEEIARQVGFLIHQDRLDDFHRLVVVGRLAVVELQHAAQVFSLFTTDYPFRLTDVALAVGEKLAKKMSKNVFMIISYFLMFDSGISLFLD